jgi:cyclopropane fatty-acyl-phospholipid synthase-like methyltransferase
MKIDNKAAIQSLYGTNDLGEKPAFQGGYINFGYWKNVDLNCRQITQEERIRSSHDLYDLVFEHLDIKFDDKILEIGCGRGYGCRELVDKYGPEYVVGIDITPNQIERAKHLHLFSSEVPSNLKFEVAAAGSTPFSDGEFNKIYAVESAQHIPSIPEFAKESWRLLKHQGQLVIAAHFSTSNQGFDMNRAHFPLIDEGIDLLIPIQEVINNFEEQGFQVKEVIKIGNQVFPGLDKWCKQVLDVNWGENFIKMYKEGNLDYYMINLQKG